MKQFKLITALCILFCTIISSSFAQETLPEVRIVSLNYKYFKSIYDSTAAQPVRMLERRAASFDLKNSEFYEEEYDNYFVSFYIPEGEILAFYDKEGKIIHTAEKFKNIALPKAVTEAVASRFPQWSVSKDVYLVNYLGESREPRKLYKLLLENGSKRLRIKTNDKGEIKE